MSDILGVNSIVIFDFSLTDLLIVAANKGCVRRSKRHSSITYIICHCNSNHLKTLYFVYTKPAWLHTQCSFGEG